MLVNAKHASSNWALIVNCLIFSSRQTIQKFLDVNRVSVFAFYLFVAKLYVEVFLLNLK